MTITVHKHPKSGKEIRGRKLKPGDVLEVNDVYDSLDGEWEKVRAIGTTIPQSDHMLWVRPKKS